MTLVAPIGVAAWYREWTDLWGFVVALVATVSLGTVMRRVGGVEAAASADRLRRVEGLAVVTITWLLIAHLAALPYVWAGLGFIDALFESMSGLTTTGATIFTDFTAFGRGVFFWRALTHWLGGMGIIAVFVAVLPALAVAGRQMFFAEAPGPVDEALTPRIRHTASALWKLYAGLTAVQTALLWAFGGMDLFEAVCHSFATSRPAGSARTRCRSRLSALRRSGS